METQGDGDNATACGQPASRASIRSNAALALRMPSTARGKPPYTVSCTMTSSISSRVTPWISAPGSEWRVLPRGQDRKNRHSHEAAVAARQFGARPQLAESPVECEFADAANDSTMPARAISASAPMRPANNVFSTSNASAQRSGSSLTFASRAFGLTLDAVDRTEHFIDDARGLHRHRIAAVACDLQEDLFDLGTRDAVDQRAADATCAVLRSSRRG